MQLSRESVSHSGERISLYCKKIVLTVLFLFLTIFSIYGNSLDCSWHYDDGPNITDNPRIHLKELSWDHIKRAFFSDLRHPEILYRPVTCISFALNYFSGGLNVFGFHLVNILIHFFTSIFLFLFIFHTLNLPSLEEKYASNAYAIAILATILWAINPIQTQAVTFIVQRMTSLAGLFYIMSMFFYLKARTTEKRGKGVLYYLFCLLAFAMAFGSKENAALLPLSLFLYEILIIGKRQGRETYGKIKIFFIIIGVTVLFCLLYLYYINGNVLSFMDGYGQRPFSLKQRLLTEPRVIIFYISLLIYPVPGRLSLMHSIHISKSLFSPMSTVVAIVFILGAIGYLVYKARKWPLLSFSFLFFFLNHMIESTIFPLELIYEHRNYVPSMFFFVPVSIGLCYLLDFYKTKRLMRTAVSVLIVFLLIGYGHATFIRNIVWKNEKSLWIDTVEKAPGQFRAHHNLGKFYKDHGYMEKAISEYHKALNSPFIHRMDEKFIAYYNLGRLWDELNNQEKAKYFYKKVLQIKPGFAQALVNLSSIYNREGRNNLADEYLFEAFKANPHDISVNLNMGLYFLRAGSPEKAIHYFLILKNDQKLGKNSSMYLGIAYKQLGLYGKAAICFRKSIQLNPKNITPRLQLMEIYSMTGHESMCRQETQTIVTLMSQDNKLFHKIMELIIKKGGLGHVDLSADLLLPLISKACYEKSKQLTGWADNMGNIPWEAN